MNTAWLKPLLIRTGHQISKHAPGILMGMGTVGTITSVIFAIQATPKAAQMIYDARVEKVAEEEKVEAIKAAEMVDRDRTDIQLTVPEKIRACWKAYLPTAGIWIFSIGCFWGAHGIDLKRQALIAGLYSTAEEALREYQKKVAEMVGEKNEREIRNEMQREKIEKTPLPSTVIVTGGTDMWCTLDGQYFRSNYNKIKKTENDANHEMIQNLYLSQSELYWMLDPDRRSLMPTRNSGSVGWSVDRMLELHVESFIGPEGEPVLAVTYEDRDGRPNPPQAGFSASL